MIRRWWAGAGCLAVAMTMPFGAHAQSVLKLGVHASFSGAGAAFAAGMLGATELAAEDANKSGGLDVAGKRYRIEIKQYDDRYRAQDAVTAMDRLIIEDGIRYVVGPMGSAAAVATKEQTSSAKIITMTLAFSPRALGADSPFAFRTVITTGEFSEPQIAWLVKTKSPKRIGALLPNDETGQQMGSANMASYVKAGAKPQIEYFERERVDFVPILTRFLSQSDALEIGGNSPTTAGLIVKQARELGYSGPIFITGGDVTAEVVKVAGKAASEGIYVHLPLDPELPETAAYIARYKSKYGPNMNAFSPFFYAGLQMLFDSIQKAGTIEDTAKVANQLERLSGFPTVVGKASWTGEKTYGIAHQIDLPYYIGQIRDGNVVRVASCGKTSCE